MISFNFEPPKMFQFANVYTASLIIPTAHLRIPVSLFIHMCHVTSIFVLLLNVENVFSKECLSKRK